MDPVYVTGHKNPDTDSIVSAMAYAALRNALGDRQYTAARLGHISDETKMVLNRFGFNPPMKISTMRTQVRDIDYDTPPALNTAVTIHHAWSILQKNTSIPAVPVVNDDNTLFGMLSTSDIASFNMRSMADPSVENIPLFNIISVLEGQILNDAGYRIDKLSGEVLIALPQDNNETYLNRKNTILLCGQQPELIRKALLAGIHCVIVCQSSLSEELRNLETETCLISTPFDAFKAARLIFQSCSIDKICRTEDLSAFHVDDFIDDVSEVVTHSRHRSYPILDENGCVVGTLSRFHMIKPRRKKLVLVDHNERAQSVDGLEQAEILEIIDHHRLADIETLGPIFFRNEPVGSTATIIAGMFQEHGIMPVPSLAGLIAAAIVADTVMFKSPTCTERDRRMADRLARIAGVSLDELGQEIFAVSAGTTKPANELFYSDFKDFHIAGHNLGVAQITTIDSNSLLNRKEEFLEIMQKNIADKGYSMMVLMLTDVLKGGSHLVVLGDTDDTIRQAFNTDLKDNTCFLPKVLSRKKQIIPALSALWG